MNPFLDNKSSSNDFNNESLFESKNQKKIQNQDIRIQDASNQNKLFAPELNENHCKSFRKSNLLNQFMQDLNNANMFKCKLFYFFFYAAFGSLFPLIAIYFKQLGLSSTQTGVLLGARPLIEIFSAPFWVKFAEKFHKVKIILLASLCCWIIYVISIATVKTPAEACISYNGSNFILYFPHFEDNNLDYRKIVTLRNKRSTNFDLNKNIYTTRLHYFKSGLAHYAIFQHKQKQQLLQNLDSNHDAVFKLNPSFRLSPNYLIGKSPLKIEFILNQDEDLNKNLVSPTFSHNVYNLNDINEVFFLLFLIILIGEIFSSPVIALIDAITIHHLGNNLDDYNKQRIFGSIGWAISMLFVGILLDNSTVLENHPCGLHLQERNYSICFEFFAFFMILSCLVASKFSFKFSNETSISNQIEMKNDCLPEQKLKPSSTRTSKCQNKFENNKKFEFIEKFKSSVFAQRTKKFPNLICILKCFLNPNFTFLIVLAWFMGTGVGLVFSFLFWHLQDLGGTPTLFGIASIINHVSEIAAYFFSLHFIKKYGYTRILYLDLFCNFFRFLYISYIDNAWLILPFELIQGVTHATVLVTLCSLLNQLTENEKLQNNYQVILQLAYTGFGKGLGSIIGGLMIDSYGTKFTFAIYAFASLFFTIIFFIVMSFTKYHLNSSQTCQKSASFKQTFNQAEDVKQNEDLNKNFYVATCLPHGVPAAAFKQNPIKPSIEINMNSESSKIDFDTIKSKPEQPEQPDLIDVILNKNFRDWRITLNKNQNLN